VDSKTQSVTPAPAGRSETIPPDPRAPMAAAPLKYAPDGSVDWGNMWDSFCALAQTGGPPHRATLLHAPDPAAVDPTTVPYQAAAAEIIRGIRAVSGLSATLDQPGWIGVQCHSAAQARWLADAILNENVEAQARGDLLLVPVAAGFTTKGEIKNVITVVAKTTHYWLDHLPSEVKQVLGVQLYLQRLGTHLKRWIAGGQAAE